MKLRLSLLIFSLVPAALQAQAHEHDAAPARWLGWGASAIPLLTHATPAQHGRDLTEAYLTQPNLFLHARAYGLNGQATINLEGLTLQRGELNAGNWGEGYVDRRHPHTYLHEAVVWMQGNAGDQGRWSVTAGKGFAPFGTDDPMSRPFIKFPANHHLAQILERLVLISAAGYGPVTLEGGLFNGDEPLGPKSLGSPDRFGDSWAARLTLRPFDGYEFQVSRANLESPEQPAGNVLDQHKWSVSLRYSRMEGDMARYLLVEWARTGEINDGNEVFALHSALAEGALQHGNWLAGLRLERTVRPEEERAGSIFRSPWPHGGERIWGLTRWIIATANVSRSVTFHGLRAAPALEVSRQWANPTVESVIFTPEQLFGSSRLWSVSLGVRLSAGTLHGRMGRYGAAR